VAESSVAVEPFGGIAVTGRHALALTAVLKFLLAGSGVGRSPRTRSVTQVPRAAT